ncbi:Maf-like protein [Bacillus sp. OxB-1]|uniref:Maf family protein n=1 Tax=Bacillus sp. (strain OxB-1) TaxID=98228 RepID=UPI000581E604|nr:Maf family protein [Bacillus sp. OxB-1]BAQ11580.1 Maf-like protein [Bacillus sp. OxB-1]
MKFMATKPVILASGSPRRKELLGLLGFPFEVIPSHVSEDLAIDDMDGRQYVEALAKEKTMAVAQLHDSAIVIGADTIVSLDGRIYPKPDDAEEAKRFLEELSNNTHTVTTGVGIYVNGEVVTFSVETKVTFRELDIALIDAYVASGDPMDKAGAYGIQTAGALFVDKIEGDYHAVVGLPIAELAARLQGLGLISIGGPVH